jgi:hypothetical protein
MAEPAATWLAPNVPGLYPNLDVGRCKAFKRIPHEQVPRLPPVDGSFDWLPPLAPGCEPIPLVVDDGEDVNEDPRAVAEHVARLADEVRAASLELPASFVTFASSPRFAMRMTSVNGGYFEIGTLEPGALVRFFADPQTFSWVLLLDQHTVAFAYLDGDRDNALSAPTLCAPSFEQFIQRWQIENSIAHALVEKAPVEGELRTYLEATTAAR